MTKILAVNKRENKVIYTFSKDNQFYKKITKTLLATGLSKDELPPNFPAILNEQENSLNLEEKSDFYEETSMSPFDLTLVYGKDKIFAIAKAEKSLIKKFNEQVNNQFCF
jgi:hypothetical protein